jgi:hydrogenase nickel incorporation protein HypA/HybF
MHEVSLLESMLDLIEDNAQDKNYSRVKRVCIEIGTLSCVEPDALRFAFDVVMQNTLADDALLDILTMPGQAWCPICGKTIGIDSLYDPCPSCQSFDIRVTQGMEIRLKELDVE